MSKVPSPAQLLADAEWLKRLAITLASNSDDADDLVQESWIALWRQSPDSDRPLRPWLAKVIRDVAGMRRRAESRRRAREEVAYVDQSVAAPDELLEQVRLHRLLVDLVLELDEPYRSTVIARFVEGRSAAAIARASGIPESTVRGRLREALARLRSALDAKRGDRKAWAPAVLAFTNGGIEVAKPTKSILLVIALLAALVGVLVVALSQDETPAERAASATSEKRPPHGSNASARDAGMLEALLASGRAPGWITQAGAPRRRIAGRVLVEGAPTAGVLVRLTSDLSLTGLMPVLEQRTNQDGRFDFGPQIARELTVSATVPAKLAAIQHVDLRNPTVRSDAIELAIASCVVSFFGKVVDASGGPIAHAQLLREDVIGVETDASGAYDLCVPPAAALVEQLRLVVRAHGYGAISVVAAPDGRVRHDFVLTPEATIHGRARREDGSPVAYAKIWIDPDDAVGRPDEQTARASTLTDDKGQFRITGLGGGRIRIGGLGQGVTALPRVLVVTAGESTELTLTMVADGIVRGRVVENGKPVVGARITAMTEKAASAVSQGDGSFVLDRVPAGNVTFVAPPYRVRSPELFRVSPGDHNNVTLEVERLGIVRGTVRHRGMPIANAVVRVTGPIGHAVNTDAEGRFEIAGLVPGDYRLLADGARMGAWSDWMRFSLSSAEIRELDIDLVLDARISGSVVDEHGVPVARVFVRFTSEAGDEGRCMTDANGAFDCGQMAGAGVYSPAVFASAGSSIPFSFLDPAPRMRLAGGASRVSDLRLVIDARSASIRGVVVDPDGEPISDARVRAFTGNLVGDAWMPLPRGITNVDGAFRIDGLVPGTYRLEVRTRDGSTSDHPKIAAGTTNARLVVGPTCANDGDRARASAQELPTDVRFKPRSRIVFEDSIELVGWSIPERVSVGEEFEIKFVYKALRPLDRSWKIFVHLVGMKGGQWFNLDHDPMGGRCPTALWKPGTFIVDRFTASIAGTGDKTGHYNVWTGFFVGSSGEWRNMKLSEVPEEMRDTRDRVRFATLKAEKPVE